MSSSNVASHISTMTISFAPEMSSSSQLSDSMLVDPKHPDSSNLINHALETSATNETNLEESDISCDVEKFSDLGPDTQIIPQSVS